MATEKRLIDANALIRRFKVRGCFKKDMLGCMVAKIINTAPTVDAVEVVHGHWYWKPDNDRERSWTLTCSVCESQEGTSESYNYCPNCGAKMDGERKNNGQA